MEQGPLSQELAVALFLGFNALLLLASYRWSRGSSQPSKHKEVTSAAIVRRSLSRNALDAPKHAAHSVLAPYAPSDQVEILVHNVSHTDMVLTLEPVPSNPLLAADSVLARPKFNFYNAISTKVLSTVRAMQEAGEEVTVEDYPVYTRQASTRKFPIKKDMEGYKIPVGFKLPSCPSLEVEDLGQLRYRRDDRSKITSSSARITGCFFPLLSVLVPKWARVIKETGRGNARRVLFLVTGVGTPRDTEKNVTDNSTEAVGRLMEIYLRMTHQEIHDIIHVHSTTNIFRYFENIMFVKDELLPQIDKYRNELAEKHGARWRDLFHITISFADGSPARITAINASLRPYRPNYMHFWQLKTFWHETKICEDDIEVHSFEEIETIPPILIEDVDARARVLVNAMLAYKDEFVSMIQQEIANDVESFWLRKTRKLVLAALLVQKQGSDEYKVYRGTNMEVSMPTGSLCAERNTIGTALGEDLSLRRQDLKMIAVLSVSLKKVEAEARSPQRGFPMLPDVSTSRQSSPGFVSAFPDIEPSDFELPPPAGAPGLPDLPASPPRPTSAKPAPVPHSPSTRFTKLRPYNQPSEGNGGLSLTRERTIVVEETDLNPLKPCGACNEWLKKIAEVNPDFTVVTFTDAECTGVFLEHILLS